MRAGTRFSQLLNLRVFQHRVMGESSSAEADKIGQDVEEETVQWTILLASIFRWMSRMFCVLDREGVVVRESKAESTAEAIAGELAKAPTCRRIVFETGRMAPILFHGLSQLGLPVVCASLALTGSKCRGSNPKGRSKSGAVGTWQTATSETEISDQRLSAARAANEPQRPWNRLGRPTAAAASRGNVVLFYGLVNHVDLRGLRGGGRSPAEPVSGG